MRSRSPLRGHTAATSPGRIITVLMVGALLLLAVLGTVVAVHWMERGVPARTILAVPDLTALAVDPPAGLLVVQTPDWQVRTFAATTGALRRTFTASNFMALAVVPSGDHLFVVESAGAGTRVAMLNVYSGAVLGTSSIPLAADVYPDAVGTWQNRLFLALPANGACLSSAPSICHSGVAILDAQTGRLMHVLPMTGQPLATGVDGRRGRLLVAGYDNRAGGYIVSLLNSASGRLLHRFPIALEPMQVAVDEATARAFIPAASPSSGRPNTNVVYVVDLQHGHLLRTIHLRYLPRGIAVAVRTGRIFVTDSGPHAQVRPHGVPRNSVGIDMPTGPADVYVLDARSGRVLRTDAIGADLGQVAVDERRGRVYVASGGSRDEYYGPFHVTAPFHSPSGISVLDAATGRLRQTIALGTWPWFIALDEQANRAYIGDLEDGNPVPITDPWSWLPGWLRQRLPFLPHHTAASYLRPCQVIMLDTSHL